MRYSLGSLFVATTLIGFYLLLGKVAGFWAIVILIGGAIGALLQHRLAKHQG